MSNESITMGGIIELLKQPINELYNIDITKANPCISSRNIGFIFPDEDYVLRINLAAKNHVDVLSEAFFVDYIKLFVDTICEPQPSLSGKLVEDIIVENKTYYVVKFKKALGKISTVVSSERMMYICAGDLLGRLHKASSLQASEGFAFKRPQWDEQYVYSEQAVIDLFPADAPYVDNIKRILNEVKALPKNSHTYGLIHGDFDPRNMFADANNLWLFDFDDCCYHYFAYDIATYIFNKGMTHAANSGKSTFIGCNEILDDFLIGYTIHMDFTEEDRALVSTMMMLRVVFCMVIAATISQDVITDETKFSGQVMTALLSYPHDADIYTRMDLFFKTTNQTGAEQ